MTLDTSVIAQQEESMRLQEAFAKIAKLTAGHEAWVPTFSTRLTDIDGERMLSVSVQLGEHGKVHEHLYTFDYILKETDMDTLMSEAVDDFLENLFRDRFMTEFAAAFLRSVNTIKAHAGK